MPRATTRPSNTPVPALRKIIRDRVAVGLTQRDLAKLAGIRVEHLCRIETGKHTPSLPTIDKIDRALKQASKRAASKGRRDVGG